MHSFPTAALHRLRFLLTHREPAIIIASVLLVGAASSYLLALLSLLMEARGFSNTIIGFSHAIQMGAAIIAGLFLMQLLNRISLLNGFILAALTCSATILLISLLFQSEDMSSPSLFAIRFLLGLGVSGCYLGLESWLNSLAHSGNRGRMIGIYSTFLAIGLGLGPLSIPIVGKEGWLPFLLPALIFSLTIPTIMVIRHTTPTLPLTPFRQVIRQIFVSPSALAATVVFGISDACLLTLIPLYGLAQGLSESQSVSLVSIGMLGSILLIIPLSLLSDRMNKRRLLALCSLASTLCCLALILASGFLQLSIIVFIWSGIFSMLYILPLALLGEKCASSNIAIASMTVIVMYGIGSLLGPGIAGTAMDYLGQEGLPLTLFIMSGLALLVVLLRLKTQE